MYAIMDFIFKNIVLIIVILLIIYIFVQYKKLKDESSKIIATFEKVLNNYLIGKIKEAQDKANIIKEKYKEDDVIKPELDRLLIPIEKGINGLINDKVECSNAINKYKPNKKLDLEKYPELIELDNLGTFSEEDLSSLDNGLALARKEYNAMAFRYNEKSTSFPMQYLTKILGLTPYFVIFDALPSQSYAANYEVFEETEPVLDTISVLNQSTSDFQSNDDVYIDSLNIMNRKEEKIIEEKKEPNEENHDEQEPSSL